MHEILTGRDKAFHAFTCLLLGLLSVIIAYPLYFVAIASISDPQYIAMGEVVFLPKGLNVDGYAAVFEDPSILTGYLNSFLYALVG